MGRRAFGTPEPRRAEVLHLLDWVPTPRGHVATGWQRDGRDPGGVARNRTANQRLRDARLFDNVYVSPVSSDRGLALGCTYHGAALAGDKPVTHSTTTPWDTSRFQH